MECTYCRQRLLATAPHVRLVINGDSMQVYCGSPAPGSVDGQSCWQQAIEAWHQLIQYEKVAPRLSLERRAEAVLTVRRSRNDSRGRAQASMSAAALASPLPTAVGSKRGTPRA